MTTDINIIRDKINEACDVVQKAGWKIEPRVSLDPRAKCCCILGAVGIYNYFENCFEIPSFGDSLNEKGKFFVFANDFVNKAGASLGLTHRQIIAIVNGFDGEDGFYSETEFFALGKEFLNRYARQ